MKECIDLLGAPARVRTGTGGIPVWKHALDLTCLLLAAPVVLPVMVAVAVLIKIVSPGPVFFHQERIGYLGRPFRCFKFRTMKVNADTSCHQQHLQELMSSDTPMTKMDQLGDPRVIPLGAALRSSGLDELPQLINVLRREMSLVGPRPCTPYEYDYYLPWHRQRFGTLPGLTGLWQVSGKNKTTFTEMIQLDIEYVRTKSLWLDLKILARTLPAVATQVRELQTRPNGAKAPQAGRSGR